MTSFLVFILTHEPFVTFSLLCPAVEWQSVFAAYLASRQGQTELAHTSPLLWGWAPHPLTILNTDLPYLFWASGDRDGLEFFQVFSCHIKSFLVPNSQCYGACWLFFFQFVIIWETEPSLLVLIFPTLEDKHFCIIPTHIPLNFSTEY